MTWSGPKASPSASVASTGCGTCFGRFSHSPIWNGQSRSFCLGRIVTGCACRSPPTMSASHSCAWTVAPLARGERSEAAEVGAMAVRDDDPLQVGDAPAQAVDCPEHGPGVAVEEGVDERELTAVLEEEGPYVAALAAAEAVDGRGELGHVETIRRSRG